MRKLLLLLLLSLGFVGFAYADTESETCFSDSITRGDKAFNEKDYNTAFEEYWKAMEWCRFSPPVPPIALLNLAWMFENGEGTLKSHVVAFWMYEQILSFKPKTYDEYMLTTTAFARVIPLLFKLNNNGNITDEELDELLNEVIEGIRDIYFEEENTPDVAKEIIEEVWETHGLWLYERL